MTSTFQSVFVIIAIAITICESKPKDKNTPQHSGTAAPSHSGIQTPSNTHGGKHTPSLPLKDGEPMKLTEEEIKSLEIAGKKNAILRNNAEKRNKEITQKIKEELSNETMEYELNQEKDDSNGKERVTRNFVISVREDKLIQRQNKLRELMEQQKATQEDTETAKSKQTNLTNRPKSNKNAKH